MLAFSNDYYGMIFRATQSVELFCAYKLTDSDLADYIIIGVTEGCSYDILKARLDIPCCKDVYYELYRKFFWLLDKERQ